MIPWMKTLHSLARGGVVCMLSLILALLLYSCASSRTLKREIAATARDARTGVVLGAEPLVAAVLRQGSFASSRVFA